LNRKRSEAAGEIQHHFGFQVMLLTFDNAFGKSLQAHSSENMAIGNGKNE
jgi:hypothetical protein